VKIDCVAFTHNGLVRRHNEDCILCDGWMRNRQMTEPIRFSFVPGSLGTTIFALADGLGGHSSGEVASQFALSKLCSSIADMPEVSESAIADAIRDTHRSLFNVSSADPLYRGMGATVAGLVVDNSGAVYHFHVGDSRVYRREDRFLQMLTADDRLDVGEYGESDPDFRPTSSLLQCLGGLTEFCEIEPHVVRFEMADGPEMFLLCSDGLSDMISQDAMEESISQSHEATVQALFDRVRAAGATDNVSIMIVEVSQSRRPQDGPVPLHGERGSARDARKTGACVDRLGFRQRGYLGAGSCATRYVSPRDAFFAVHEVQLSAKTAVEPDGCRQGVYRLVRSSDAGQVAPVEPIPLSPRLWDAVGRAAVPTTCSQA
jgi:serine/threonine protein phosphatase PrpC